MTTTRFIPSEDGLTVAEPARNLIWTRDDVGDGQLTFAQAETAIAKLNAEKFAGFTDWRLPMVEELFLLADRTRFDPAIDTDAFPSCKSSWYWTSTDDASEEKDEESGTSEFAWFVDFGYGHSDSAHRFNNNRVRAVRGASRQ